MAPLFAVLATFVLAPAVAIGIDMNRAISVHARLQDAVDAAALAVGRLPSDSSADKVKATAQTWVSANLAGTDVGDVQLTVTPGAKTVDIAATTTSPTMLRSLGAMAGLDAIPVSAQATTQWGLSSVELVMVLDNSTSMNGAKLSHLVAAANTLINTLTAQTKANGGGSVKIGLVPFNTMVNIGSGYQGQPWLSGVMPSAYGADIFSQAGVDRFTLLRQIGQTWGGCVEDRPMPYDVQDTAPTASNPATLFVPAFAPDEPDVVANTSDPVAHYSNNYEFDIATDTDWTARQGNASKYTRPPRNRNMGNGPNKYCTSLPIQRLTTDAGKAKAAINSMIDANGALNGTTEIPLGLMWGWHLLSPNAPFADGQPYGTPNLLKVIVLVTDGENTYPTGLNYQNDSEYTGIGYKWQARIATDSGDTTHPERALDARLAKLCTNINNSGIVLFTVPVEVTTANIKGLLQTCASTSDDYIDAKSSSDLQAAFAKIAASVGMLRLTK